MASPRTIYLLSRLHYALRKKIDNRLAANKLTAVKYTVMSMLRGRRSLSSAEIARRYCVTPQSMNETICALERSDCVTKEENPENKRILLVSLTPTGHDMLERCDKIIDQIERELFAEIGQADVERFRSTLQTVMAAAMGPNDQETRAKPRSQG